MVANPQIILIDGPAGSGKTTLSKELSEKLNCQVVHLDDHYNGWDEALSNDLTQALLKIVSNFSNGRPSEIPTFNWLKAKFEGSRVIEPANTLIIEGVGSGQSQIRPFASKLYWVETEPEIGLFAHRLVVVGGVDRLHAQLLGQCGQPGGAGGTLGAGCRG